MLVSLELAALALLIVGFGVWGVVSGLKESRRQRRSTLSTRAMRDLAPPFRNLLAQAQALTEGLERQVSQVSGPLKPTLNEVASRSSGLLLKALPRAQHGTRLLEFLAHLDPKETSFTETEARVRGIEAELEDLVQTLKTLRSKVFGLLSDAPAQSGEALRRELDETLLHVGTLEAAFNDLGSEKT